MLTKMFLDFSNCYIFPITLIKQYFSECVFVALAGSGLSWINKYDTKTASRWRQVPV